MIVLDENIYDPQLTAHIDAWYRGQGISINSLRPSTLVKDDSIPALLLQISQPLSRLMPMISGWKYRPIHGIASLRPLYSSSIG